MAVLKRRINEAVVLTPEQEGAVQAVIDWYLRGGTQTTTLGGFAGVGKSTVIKSILSRPEMRCESVAVCAFTGKAASVLIQKGMPQAGTLHSLMYHPVEHKDDVSIAGLELDAAYTARMDQVAGITAAVKKTTKKKTEAKITIEFIRKPEISASFVVVDEASMISGKLYADLLSFGVRVLFVGDMGQLEPIGDNPNLMKDPRIKLTTIHRQAAKSPIVKFSTLLRTGQPPREWYKVADGKHLILGDRQTFTNMITKVEQGICGYNKTRVYFNSVVRQSKGYNELICIGDRVICLRNQQKLGLFNGLMAVVSKIKNVTALAVTVDLQTEVGSKLQSIVMERKQFGSANTSEINDRYAKRPIHNLTYWDYAYVVTCHKSQGSGFRTVAVLEEMHPNWTPERWRYTAATRAEEQLIYCR